MWYSLPQELVNLQNEYKNKTSREDRRIALKLNEIVACYGECTAEERELADDITKKFCELFKMLKESSKSIVAENNMTNHFVGQNYMSYQSNGYAHNEERIPFENGEELIVAFYNRFRNEQKKKSNEEKVEYPAICCENDLKELQPVNLTMRDYIARINTFFNQYMYEMPRIRDLWINPNQREDPILFIYMNLELILANFDTRKPDGGINKQKSNIQSALRKLNEFKREQK